MRVLCVQELDSIKILLNNDESLTLGVSFGVKVQIDVLRETLKIIKMEL